MGPQPGPPLHPGGVPTDPALLSPSGAVQGVSQGSLVLRLPTGNDLGHMIEEHQPIF